MKKRVVALLFLFFNLFCSDNQEIVSDDFDIFTAIQGANIFELKKLLDSKVNPNQVDSDGQTPLGCLIQNFTPKHASLEVQMMDVLFQYGADPSQKIFCTTEKSKFYYANGVIMSSTLLKSSSESITPLNLALQNRLPNQIVTKLLIHGANPNMGNPIEIVQKQLAHERTEELYVILKLLLSYGALARPTSVEHEDNPLVIAIKMGSEVQAKYMLCFASNSFEKEIFFAAFQNGRKSAFLHAFQCNDAMKKVPLDIVKYIFSFAEFSTEHYSALLPCFVDDSNISYMVKKLPVSMVKTIIQSPKTKNDTIDREKIKEELKKAILMYANEYCMQTDFSGKRPVDHAVKGTIAGNRIFDMVDPNNYMYRSQLIDQFVGERNY